ncbi:MAG: hypothetical protein ACFCD0_06575 [Gemmataceae bacterium]
MNALEWESCADPDKLLNALSHGEDKRKVWFGSDPSLSRKGRLLVLASCDRVCPKRASAPLGELFTLAFRYLETPPPLHAKGWLKRFRGFTFNRRSTAVYLALTTPVGNGLRLLRECVHEDSSVPKRRRRQTKPMTSAQEGVAQAHLIRDIYANPWAPLEVDELERGRWLRWNNACIRHMAAAMYQSGDFQNMPILADALEEAGCEHEEILEHCRGYINGLPRKQQHVKGCWVVDMLLGQS